MTDDEYKVFKIAVEKQRKVVTQKQKLVDKQQVILKTLLEQCPHAELKEESSYYDGDYYNKAYTDYWNVCTMCGARSEKTRKGHTYYG